MKLSKKFTVAALIVGINLTMGVSGALAYNTFGNGSGNKWGNPTFGTGATVTWSFLPAGTAGSAFCGSSCTGLSTTMLNMYSDPINGLGFAPVDITTTLLPNIQSAFNSWATVSNINFVYNPSDSGVAINDLSAAPPATGEIRIGVFSGVGGAVGYAPPPNGGTGAGDILFNANAYFQIAPGAEGALITTTYAPNDFEGLFVHELGHALGLDHSGVATAVMCGYHLIDNPSSACDYTRINRSPKPDDIAGIQSIYGSPVPLPLSAWLFGSGLLGLVGVSRRKRADNGG